MHVTWNRTEPAHLHKFRGSTSWKVFLFWFWQFSCINAHRYGATKCIEVHRVMSYIRDTRSKASLNSRKWQKKVKAMPPLTFTSNMDPRICHSGSAVGEGSKHVRYVRLAGGTGSRWGRCRSWSSGCTRCNWGATSPRTRCVWTRCCSWRSGRSRRYSAWTGRWTGWRPWCWIWARRRGKPAARWRWPGLPGSARWRPPAAKVVCGIITSYTHTVFSKRQ